MSEKNKSFEAKINEKILDRLLPKLSDEKREAIIRELEREQQPHPVYVGSGLVNNKTGEIGRVTHVDGDDIHITEEGAGLRIYDGLDVVYDWFTWLSDPTIEGRWESHTKGYPDVTIDYLIGYEPDCDDTKYRLKHGDYIYKSALLENCTKILEEVTYSVGQWFQLDNRLFMLSTCGFNYDKNKYKVCFMNISGTRFRAESWLVNDNHIITEEEFIEGCKKYSIDIEGFKRVTINPITIKEGEGGE